MNVSRFPYSKFHLRVPFFGVCLVGILLSGCSASNSVRDSDSSTRDYRTSRTYSESAESSKDSGYSTSAARSSTEAAKEDHSQLVLSMSGWLNTPYQYGGTLKSGIDCSAYVQLMMEKAFQVSLPRTTREQLGAGTKVSKNKLQPGDLVFFKTGPNQYHVGIYLADGEFTHASTSSGVTVSHLGDYYWRDKYLESRRVMTSVAANLVDDAPAERVSRPAASKPYSSNSQAGTPLARPTTSESGIATSERSNDEARERYQRRRSKTSTNERATTGKSSKKDTYVSTTRKTSGTWTSSGDPISTTKRRRIGW